MQRQVNSRMDQVETRVQEMLNTITKSLRAPTPPAPLALPAQPLSHLQPLLATLNVSPTIQNPFKIIADLADTNHSDNLYLGNVPRLTIPKTVALHPLIVADHLLVNLPGATVSALTVHLSRFAAILAMVNRLHFDLDNPIHMTPAYHTTPPRRQPTMMMSVAPGKLVDLCPPNKVQRPPPPPPLLGHVTEHIAGGSTDERGHEEDQPIAIGDFEKLPAGSPTTWTPTEILTMSNVPASFHMATKLLSNSP